MTSVPINNFRFSKTDDLELTDGAVMNPLHSDPTAPISFQSLSGRRDGNASVADMLASGFYKLSVVIPMYNEEDNLDNLYTRLKAELDRTAPNHEMIFVDDGSRDRSFEKAFDLWQQDSSVVALKLRQNSGKAAALMAGFAQCSGDLVLMMDADLQDQPEELPRLIGKMDEGFDLVTGWKFKRHDPIHKTLPSKLFNKTIANHYDLQIHDFNCGYKLMTANVARSLKIYGDYHRFIPVLAANNGFRVAEQVVEHAPRVAGVSKYGAKRLVTGMLDFWSSIIVTKFRNKPLQFFGAFGLTLLILGAAAGIDLGISYATDHTAHDRPMWVMMALFLLSGMQVIGIGLLGELMIGLQNRKDGLYELSHKLSHNSARSMPTVSTPATMEVTL